MANSYKGWLTQYLNQADTKVDELNDYLDSTDSPDKAVVKRMSQAIKDAVEKTRKYAETHNLEPEAEDNQKSILDSIESALVDLKEWAQSVNWDDVYKNFDNALNVVERILRILSPILGFSY